MIAELYAAMCGTELWNRDRLYNYVRNGITPAGMKLHCPSCPNLSDILPCVEDRPPEPDGYRLPELDPAPWYDPAAPESMNFAGFLVLETILSPAVDRRMVQSVGHGGTLTRARYQARTLYVRGALIGRTCCATYYGLTWLTRALLGSSCNCDGCSLTFFTSCPSSTDDNNCLNIITTDPETQQETYTPYFRETEDDEWARGTDFARYMCGAGLLKAPEIIACHGVGGCGTCSCSNITEIEFTIGIEKPWVNKYPVTEFDEVILNGCDVSEDCIEFAPLPNCDRLGWCGETNNCADDPNCEEVAVPPKGRAPELDCGCIPFITGRNCFIIPVDREWFDQTLIIDISAGSEPLRNIAVRAWKNPLGLDCCGEANAAFFQDCDACATLFITYIPAGGVLHFDSSCREVTLECDAQLLPGAPNLNSIEGMSFDWFDVGCNGACVAIDVDCVNLSPDATVTIQSVGREL